MEASASNKTKKARTTSSAAPIAGSEACAGAGASPSASEPLEAASSKITRSMARAAAGASPFADLVVRLPAALVQHVFLLLPACDRTRCRAVSRAWRAALADRGCWRILRFSDFENLPRLRGNFYELERFILAASRAAGGIAEEIDARVLPYHHCLLKDCLKRVSEANGASLRVLRLSGMRECVAAANILSIASSVNSGKLQHLEVLEADVVVKSVDTARQMLDGPRQPHGRFKALRIRMLDIRAGRASADGVYETPERQRQEAQTLAALLRKAAPRHPSLVGLKLHNMPLLHPGLIGAVTDAVVACGLEDLHLHGPHINVTCLPALSRALRCGRLRSLVLCGSLFFDNSNLFSLDGPRGTHEEFCAALHESRLESLTLRGLQLWADPDNGGVLLAALTSHPTLRNLSIVYNHSGGAASKAAAAEAVATLLVANAPALKSLGIAGCELGGEQLERILKALRGNRHLTALDCAQRSGGRGVDEAFAKRVVLPLVRANATLRTLDWDSNLCGAVGAEIDRIMKARGHYGPSYTW